MELAYHILNNGQRDIYLFTPLTDFRGQDWVPISNRVYVFWDENEIAHLTKRAWPVPDEVEVFMPEVPYLTRVPTGQSFEEHLRLPLPLLVNFPYRAAGEQVSAAPRKPVMRESKGAVFSVGYFIPKDGASELDPVPGIPGNFRVSYGTAIEGQQILKGKAIDLRVMVRE